MNIKNNSDKIKNISLYWYKNGKQTKQRTYSKLKRKFTRLLASLNFKNLKIYDKIEIVVRYKKGDNSMTLKNKEDVEWCYQSFIQEYES